MIYTCEATNTYGTSDKIRFTVRVDGRYNDILVKMQKYQTREHNVFLIDLQQLCQDVREF